MGNKHPGKNKKGWLEDHDGMGAASAEGNRRSARPGRRRRMSAPEIGSSEVARLTPASLSDLVNDEESIRKYREEEEDWLNNDALGFSGVLRSRQGSSDSHSSVHQIVNEESLLTEFLDGFELLDHVLVDKAGDYHANVGEACGDFLGKTHARTHSSKVSKERRESLTKHYENREMRDIQLEYVFTKCYKESTDEERAGLDITPEFLQQVDLLKKQYNGESSSLVLCHGDIHPGSVMVNPQGATKIIDPEFTVYGPPGLDVGSLLSGYCLGAIHQAYANNPDGVARIVAGAKQIWEAYSKAMKEEGLEHLVNDIGIETVGFTVAEICRTALGHAGGRKWLQFEDPTPKAAAIKAAMRVVDHCMIARHTGGMDLLFREMSQVVVRE